ncbi:MAG: phosphate signaling complex protein PhoU [Candidatus Tectomicrobia bacterium]|nr:phosphate signaling complex protein PhoU [Candidatus Tectomicrobia bacterium]
MERHFHEELQKLKQDLLYMASLAESMVDQSVKALKERKEELLKEVFQKEEKLNRLQIEIDDRCFELLALHQPMATDLRFIIATMKITSDLERIGDLAINIAQNTTSLLKHPPLKPLIDIPRMAEIAQKMLRDSLDAFVNRDVALARDVVLRDDEVDALKDQVFRELLTYMISDPTTIPRALDLILVSRHLERVGDHATNIGEDVIYMVLGKDIRHRAEVI